MSNLTTIGDMLEDCYEVLGNMRHDEKIGIDHFPDGEQEELPVVTFQVSFPLPKDWTKMDEDSEDWEAYLHDLIWNEDIIHENINVTFIE